MLTKVHHVHYIVRNREGFMTFMERSFGLQPDAIESRPSGLGKGNLDASYQIGETILEVTQPGPDTYHSRFLDKHGPYLWHVAWGVNDIDKAVKEIHSRGVRTAGSPLDKPPLVEKGVTSSHWGYKHASIHPDDSEGVHFQIAEGQAEWQAKKAPAKGKPTLKGLHHVHYIVPDRDRLIAVIRKAFGLEPAILEDRTGGLGHGNKDASYKIGPVYVEVSAPTTGAENTLHGRVLAKHGGAAYHVAWAVDDIKKLSDDLEARGTMTHGGPVDIMGQHGGAGPSHWGYTHINVNPDYSEQVHFQMAEGKPTWDQRSS